MIYIYWEQQKFITFVINDIQVKQRSPVKYQLWFFPLGASDEKMSINTFPSVTISKYL